MQFIGDENARSIEAASAAKRENEKETLLKKLPPNADNATLFVMSAQAEYCFVAVLIARNGLVEYITKYHVHVGTIQDSVLIYSNDEKFDFRFFPYKNNRLRFYMWDEKYEPVFVYNEGTESLEIDCPSGNYLVQPETLELLDVSNDNAQITEHIAPAVDKHTVNDYYVDENGMVWYS